MRFIPTRVHGILDYTVSALLSSAPLIFKGKKYKIARALLISAGLGATVYSFFTDYELGAIKKIPMPVHLNLDLMSGLLLASAPFLLKVNREEKTPLMVAGIVEMGAALMSKKV